MGIEIQVNSLEEMCDLMCDNRLPQRGEKKMSRLIDADELLKKREILRDENRTGYQAVRTFYIRNMPTVQAVPLSVLYDLRDELQTEADRQSLITASDLNIAINRINAKIRQHERSDKG